jgi:heptosyltransferase-2
MEKIVITPLMGMGDTLMTTPALQQIKENRPDCEITFFTFNHATRDILLNNPHIDHLWYYPIKAINFVQATLHVLLHFSFRYDTCINFYPSNRIQYNVFAFMTGAKKLIGHTYLKMNFSQMNWLKNNTIKEEFKLHCVEENIRLLSFLKIEPDLTTIPSMKIYLTGGEKEKGHVYVKDLNTQPIVGIHAGTSTFKNHANRRWPCEKFVEMIDQLPDVHFLLFGTMDEVDINRDIQSAVKKSSQVTVVEEKSLREVTAIIGELDLFVSNDSGLMHIAAAMDTPVVEILGPTNPHFIYPWSVKHRIVRLDLPCSPCFFYSPKSLSCKLNNSYECLRELDTSMVVNACKELLD